MEENERILVVDDDEFVLTCFERILRNQFQIRTALGPEKALAAMREGTPFAVVMSDLRMPGMNGVELLRKVRELSPFTVGLVLSGNAAEAELSEAMQHGIVYKAIQKPCEAAQLEQILQDSLAHHRRLRQDGAA
jgi:DNA-binding NtrC family response regulator